MEMDKWIMDHFKFAVAIHHFGNHTIHTKLSEQTLKPEQSEHHDWCPPRDLG